MLKSSFSAALAVLAAISISTTTAAQTGTLDQSSPYDTTVNSSAWFNVDPSFLVWQAQVRAGIAGQLEGFNLKLDGNPGAQCDVTVRIGDGWNTTASVFTTQLTKALTGHEIVFVDTTSAAINLAVGDTFVIELQGNTTGCGVIGSYIDPAIGPALYPEPLFLMGPGCFAGCGWRIGFETYMNGAGGVTPYCFGTSCPCGNDDPTAGCKNSTGVGALLAQTGGSVSVAADNLAMSVTHMPVGVTGLIFMGNAQNNIPFHDGRKCVVGTIKRFGPQSAGGSGSISLSNPVLNSGGMITSGSTWNFQCWYRNTTGPCGTGTNVSNALKVVFSP